MRHTAAAGRCQGKTGTLTGASNLVGYCETAGGHLLAFAIFTDGISTTSAHIFQDRMAIAIAASKIAAKKSRPRPPADRTTDRAGGGPARSLGGFSRGRCAAPFDG